MEKGEVREKVHDPVGIILEDTARGEVIAGEASNMTIEIVLRHMYSPLVLKVRTI